MTTDSDAKLDDLMDRLAKIERQNRALRFSMVSAIVLGGAALILAMKPVHTIVADRLAVRDADNELVAMLTTGRDNLPVLALSNGQKPRALIGLKDDGSVYLTLSDADGKRRWSGFINENGPNVQNITAK
jgi:hypothetical protein